MAESSNPQSAPETPEERHWGINYLRQEIQGVRQDLSQEILGVRQDLSQEIQDVRQDLRQEIHQQVQGVRQDMNQRFAEVNGEIRDMRREMLDMARRFEARFTWTIGTVVTMTGILIAVMKL